MLTKQSPKLALTHAHPIGKRLKVISIQRPKFD
jgi:hypothetical protein